MSTDSPLGPPGRPGPESPVSLARSQEARSQEARSRGPQDNTVRPQPVTEQSLMESVAGKTRFNTVVVILIV